jgi:hypothetical protein
MPEATEAQTPTNRELQLELQIWNEHATALQAKGQLLQAQSALLQIEGEKTTANIERLTALLTPKPVEEVKPAAEAA